MNTNRTTIITVDLTYAELIRALRLAHPDNLDVAALPLGNPARPGNVTLNAGPAGSVRIEYTRKPTGA